MTNAWKMALPLLLLLIGSGCAAPAKRIPAPGVTSPAEDPVLKSLREQIDRSETDLRSASQEITVLQQRFKDMEARLDALAASESASLQEIRENFAALSDRVQALDASPADRKPAVRRRSSAAGVFKPGGFDLESAYREALGNYRALEFSESIRGFTEILTVSPMSTLADNAQYWIGECYYSMKSYEKAREAFEKVFAYPNTNKAADARLKIGLSFMMMGNSDIAREELRRVLAEYPDSDAAKLAAARLETLERQ